MEIRIFNPSHPSKSAIEENNNEKLNEVPKKKNPLTSLFKQRKLTKPSQQFYIGGNLDTE